jgi:hypothetical protein
MPTEAMLRVLAESLSVLKSVIEVMPALDEMMKKGDGRDKAQTSTSDLHEATVAASKWTTDDIVQMHNLCVEAYQRTPGRSSAKGYNGETLDGTGEILPPLGGKKGSKT